MALKIDVGKRIKEYRQKYNLTLKQIESRVQVSATHVSEIERGKTSPTIGALTKIARALDVDPAFFLSSHALPSVCVHRHGSRPVVQFQRPRFQIEPFSGSIPEQEMSVMLVRWEAGEVHDRPSLHEGEEFGLVLHGTLEVAVNGSQILVRAGESIHFRSDSPHILANRGEETCTAVWATVPKFGF